VQNEIALRVDLESVSALEGEHDLGNAYVTGSTTSFDFPTTAGAFQTTPRSPSFNAFVTKLNPSGTALVYSTFLGGTTTSAAYGIAVDAAGEAYVVGLTFAFDFPTTTGAFQTVHSGSIFDAFVTKFDSSGSALVYSTLLGGGSSLANSTAGNAISIDASGHAYVTGRTSSTDFPVTPGAIFEKPGGFVTQFDPSGSALVYSTYLEEGKAIAVDVDGNAFVTGNATSPDFPRTDLCGLRGGAGDAFVTMLDPRGALVYSVVLGGSGEDGGTAIAVDVGGNAYVAGRTDSNNFPTTPLAFQPQNRGFSDAFIVKIAEPVLPIPAPASPANTGTPAAMPSAATGEAATGSAQTPPPATAPSANMNSSQGSGGGAIDWLTLPALLAAVAFARGRRAAR